MTIITAFLCCVSDCHQWTTRDSNEDSFDRVRNRDNQSMALETHLEVTQESVNHFSRRFRSSVRSLVCFHTQNKSIVRSDSMKRYKSYSATEALMRSNPSFASNLLLSLLMCHQFIHSLFKFNLFYYYLQ
jgi:hypothetical protein